MSKFSLTFFIIFTICFLLFANPTSAALLNTGKIQDLNANLNSFATSTEYNTSVTLENRISTVIRIFLSLLGTVFLFLMFWTGNNWMQAAGNDEKVKEAKTGIRNLLIGLVLVIIAYALSSGFGGLLAKLLTT